MLNRSNVLVVRELCVVAMATRVEMQTCVCVCWGSRFCVSGSFSSFLPLTDPLELLVGGKNKVCAVDEPRKPTVTVNSAPETRSGPKSWRQNRHQSVISDQNVNAHSSITTTTQGRTTQRAAVTTVTANGLKNYWRMMEKYLYSS